MARLTSRPLPRALAGTILLMCTSGPASALDCHAMGGHREGQPAATVRRIALAGDQMTLSGDFGDRYVVSCQRLHPGLWCQGRADELDVVVIANGNLLLESIADRRSGREQVGLSYVCDAPLDSLR